MRDLFSLKTVVGVVSAMAITGTLYAGIAQATRTLPVDWPIVVSRVTPPVEVYLVNKPAGGGTCVWATNDPDERNAKCPPVVVTAKRAKPDVRIAAAAAQTGDSGAGAEVGTSSHPIHEQH